MDIDWAILVFISDAKFKIRQEKQYGHDGQSYAVLVDRFGLWSDINFIMHLNTQSNNNKQKFVNSIQNACPSCIRQKSLALLHCKNMAFS